MARALTAVSGFALGIWGAAEIGGGIANRVVQVVVMVIVFGVIFGTAAYFALYHEKTVDLLIETQAEMRKVSWPSRKEFLGSTFVVILSVLALGAFIWAVDQLAVVLLSVLGVY